MKTKKYDGMLSELVDKYSERFLIASIIIIISFILWGIIIKWLLN